MSTTYFWITVFLPSSINTLIGGLVQLGYGVQPTVGNRVTDSKEDDVGRFLALTLVRGGDEEDEDEDEEDEDEEDEDEDEEDEETVLGVVESDVESTLARNSILHFGYVLVSDGHQIGNPGNVKIPLLSTPEASGSSAWARLGKPSVTP